MNLTREQVVEELANFVSGRGGVSDWDDFTSIKLKDKQLDRVRPLCVDLPSVFPPQRPGIYCNERGFAVVRLLIEQLGE
jgi:hypothetical protein